MEKIIHTVLGGTGNIGSMVVDILKKQHKGVRSVSRNSNLPDVENMQLDLLEEEQIQLAVKGSRYVYFCLMLPYESKIWTNYWPNLVSSIIKACHRENARFIYLDNTYMYSKPYRGIIDETFPQSAITKKGTARKEATELIFEAIADKDLKAIVARSSDFYGPLAINNQFYIKFIENILKNKKPQSLINPEVKHCYTYNYDVARAMVLLGQDESLYGDVWHIPSSRPVALSEVLDICNSQLGTHHMISILPKALRKVMKVFNLGIREIDEMLYQFEEDSIFDTSKFLSIFPDFEPMVLEAGIKKMIDSLK